jgi:hypothetical protein
VILSRPHSVPSAVGDNASTVGQPIRVLQFHFGGLRSSGGGPPKSGPTRGWLFFGKREATAKLDWPPRWWAWHGGRWLILGLLLGCPAALNGQQPARAGSENSSLPDSPAPKQPTATNPLVDKTSRFVGYVTNRSIFFPDIATSAHPLSTAGKFKLFVDQSISPAYLLASAINAGVGQARNVPKGYGQGWDAYGDRFGAAMGRASSSSFFGTFVFSSILRQDPRFFPQSHPSFWGSVKYSAERIVVTRTDSGRPVFNASGLLGPAAAEGLANVYLPKDEQTGAKTAENMFKNYWPTIFHGMGLNRLKVIPDPGSPDTQGSQPRA